MSSFLSKEEVLSAEIVWILHSINTHQSFRSNLGIGNVFQRMFKDSPTAQQFSLSDRKMSYITSFGLAPYFTSQLEDKLKFNDYVLLFDESMNKSLQSKQMDFHVRFWDEDSVHTRYLKSEFLGHATAKDMEAAFDNVMENLSFPNLLQLSMDGPHVNWALHANIDSRMFSNFGLNLLNVGSCGLHKVHGACKAAMDSVDWQIDRILKAMHRLFKDTPARRDDYVTATGSSIFPHQFCKHRWLENAKVSQRAQDILSDLEVYVNHVKTKKLPDPKTESFDTVRRALEDKMLPAKLAFFTSVSKQVEPFLTQYQTDRPMLPFIHHDLTKLAFILLKRFMKPSELENLKSLKTLLTLNVSDTSKHCTGHKVDIGFVADNIIQGLKRKKIISDGAILNFKNDCKAFLITFCDYFLMKSPLQYSLVTYIAFLDPRSILEDKELAESRLRKVLQVLVSKRKFIASDSDSVISEFRDFVDGAIKDGSLSTFNKDNDRLDTFFHSKLATNIKDFSHLWRLVKNLLLLSHGQATVERGFSINKEIEGTNLAERTVVARRQIVDSIRAAGGVEKIPVTPKMLMNVSSAYSRYNLFLDRQKEAEIKKQHGLKRKGVSEEIEELKKKKRALSSDIDALMMAADSYALKAEKDRDFSLIAKSNSMRRSASDKTEEVKSVEKLLDEKLEELKTAA